MKRIILLFTCALLLVPVLNGQFTKIGGGLTGSSGIAWNDEMDVKSHRTSNPAITFNGIYEISVPLHIQPSFTVFMPRVTKEDFGSYMYKNIVSAMMLDVDGHYVFNSLDKLELYGLAGLNITVISMKFVSDMDGTTDKSKDSDNAFGLNVGAGTYYKLSEQFDIHGEIKYVFGKYDQLMIHAGVLINLDWLIKHENTGL